MKVEAVRNPNELARVLKIEIAECLKRIQEYERQAMLGGCSYDVYIKPEKEAIDDYERIIEGLKL